MLMRPAILTVAMIARSVAQQTWSPDEIRSTNSPYILPISSTFRTGTNLVETGVVVRDSKGTPVTGLHQQDFQIFDDKKERAIVSFSASAGGSRIAEGPPPEASARIATTAVPPSRWTILFFDDLSIATVNFGHLKAACPLPG